MNTWWKVADLLESKDLGKVEFGLEVVASSEMPDEVKAEAEQLMAQLADVQARLKHHKDRVLASMQGVMWPVI